MERKMEIFFLEDRSNWRMRAANLHRVPHHKGTPRAKTEGIDLVCQAHHLRTIQFEFSHRAQVHHFGRFRIERRVHAQQPCIDGNVTSTDFLSKSDDDQPIFGIPAIRKGIRSTLSLPGSAPVEISNLPVFHWSLNSGDSTRSMKASAGGQTSVGSPLPANLFLPSGV
jgi:hypothetical protein